MTRLWLRFLAVSTAFAAFAAAAHAEPAAFQIDKNHSRVGFEIRHFFSKVPGRFGDYDGTLMIDTKDMAASSVEVTIQAASINTDTERRDNDLRSANFFDVEKFPTITFKSTKVIPGDATHFKIEGDFTMHGVTKPVVLDVESLGMGTFAAGDRSMGTRGGFEAKTTIDRKEWGITWNRTFDQGPLLSDEVWITLQIEAVKVEPKADAPSADMKTDEKKADAKKADTTKK